MKKVAFITGASRGIGRACAIYFAEKGCFVFFCFAAVVAGCEREKHYECGEYREYFFHGELLKIKM